MIGAAAQFAAPMQIAGPLTSHRYGLGVLCRMDA
jgi:hypothetical protein